MTIDPDNPELLESYSSEMEAAMIVNALETFGIKASTTGDYISGFRAEAPANVNVMVRLHDLDRAREMLARIKNEQSDLDWSQVDVGESEGETEGGEE